MIVDLFAGPGGWSEGLRLALCNAGLAKSVARVIDLDAEAGGATGALRRFRQPAVKS